MRRGLAFVYRLEGTNTFVSKNKIDGRNVQPIHSDVSMVNSSDELDIEAFKNGEKIIKMLNF
jgi:leucyl-tRNA synthetase